MEENKRTNPPIPVGSNPMTGESPARSVTDLMREDIAEADQEPTKTDYGIQLRNSLTETIVMDGPKFTAYLRAFSALISEWNEYQGFWSSKNTGEKIALMHSELSEALEADREKLKSVKIPEFTGVEEELADCIIRILDYSGHHKLRLGEAFAAKLAFNLGRPRMHGKGY
jgi:NTP pyrophosphatase (non-canonical NTP hydrolase)